MDITTERKTDDFTTTRYETIVKYKTSLYTFFAPFVCAILASRFDQQKEDNLLRESEHISILLGYYFQCQDDFLDCYGDPSVTGKVGTDIQDGKCTWLAVHVMENGNPSQIERFQEVYGQIEYASEIKDMYASFSLQEVWLKKESSLIHELKTCMHKCSNYSLYSIVLRILASLQHRIR